MVVKFAYFGDVLPAEAALEFTFFGELGVVVLEVEGGYLGGNIGQRVRGLGLSTNKEAVVLLLAVGLVAGGGLQGGSGCDGRRRFRGWRGLLVFIICIAVSLMTGGCRFARLTQRGKYIANFRLAIFVGVFQLPSIALAALFRCALCCSTIVGLWSLLPWLLLLCL